MPIVTVVEAMRLGMSQHAAACLGILKLVAAPVKGAPVPNDKQADVAEDKGVTWPPESRRIRRPAKPRKHRGAR